MFQGELSLYSSPQTPAGLPSHCPSPNCARLRLPPLCTSSHRNTARAALCHRKAQRTQRHRERHCPVTDFVAVESFVKYIINDRDC